MQGEEQWIPFSLSGLVKKTFLLSKMKVQLVSFKLQGKANLCSVKVICYRDEVKTVQCEGLLLLHYCAAVTAV